MSFSTLKTTKVVFQLVPRNINSRRLLPHSPIYQQQAAATPPLSGNTYSTPASYSGDNSFDGNVVMIISILLCALICSLGLNSIIRCAMQKIQSSEPRESSLTNMSNTGVNKKALKTFPIVNYSADLKLPGLDAECVICLSEFAPGERVKVLPKCNHGFHVRCIDRWLTSHSSCPTCRHCLIETCQKIIGCSIAANTSQPILLPRERIDVLVAPLEAEGIIRNYQT